MAIKARETVGEPDSPTVIHALDPHIIEFTMCSYAFDEFEESEVVDKAITCSLCIDAIEGRLNKFKKVMGKWEEVK